MKMTCDNDCTINGWTEYEAESFGHDDLHISVNPSSNLDDVVIAFCHDTQEMIRLNGWNFTFYKI